VSFNCLQKVEEQVVFFLKRRGNQVEKPLKRVWPEYLDRKSILLEGIEKDQIGLEIGPYFSPLVPKAEGYKSFSIDVFNEEELRKNAASDPGIREDEILKIERVDFVGDASQMVPLVEAEGLGGELDYVISSHNFEHLPNPIRFLQGVERLLKVGGRLIMAIPDRRTCFDYFKPFSLTADFLEAYFENRIMPTPRQRFIYRSLIANYVQDEQWLGGFHMANDPHNIRHVFNLDHCFEEWKNSVEDQFADYRDSHCWYFTPASITVVLSDLAYLGLIKLNIDSIAGPNGNEFYLKMSKPELATGVPEYESRRGELLHRINDEAAENAKSFWGYQPSVP
jgi:SAM-dependent methyltransferase